MNYNKILVGKVVHKRVFPIQHKLDYNVFAVMIDCDNLHDTLKKSKIFSYNKFNLFSIFDKDHGDDVSIGTFLEKIRDNVVTRNPVKRFSMIAYPRILGYVFNPITVYIGFNENDLIEVMVYEVNNTFGQRVIYVIPVNDNYKKTIYQKCEKKLFISPFNGDSGIYSFQITDSDGIFNMGINLQVDNKPILKASFTSKKVNLSDKELIRSLKRNAFLTFKVILAIHLEAIKLFFKGLKLKKKPLAPKSQIFYFSETNN